MATDWAWCFDKPKEAASHIDRLNAEMAECNELYVAEGVKRRAVEAERDTLRVALSDLYALHRKNMMDEGFRRRILDLISPGVPYLARDETLPDQIDAGGYIYHWGADGRTHSGPRQHCPCNEKNRG